MKVDFFFVFCFVFSHSVCAVCSHVRFITVQRYTPTTLSRYLCRQIKKNSYDRFVVVVAVTLLLSSLCNLIGSAILNYCRYLSPCKRMCVCQCECVSTIQKLLGAALGVRLCVCVRVMKILFLVTVKFFQLFCWLFDWNLCYFSALCWLSFFGQFELSIANALSQQNLDAGKECRTLNYSDAV